MKNPLPKQFWQLGNKMVIEWSLLKFCESTSCTNIVLVLPEIWMEEGKRRLSQTQLSGRVNFAIGGLKREDSVLSALNCVSENEMVAIHDGARPFVSSKLISKLFARAHNKGNAVPILQASDTIIYKKPKEVSYLNREKVFMIQTPQFFRAGTLRKAIEFFKENDFSGTDDSGMVKRMGDRIFYVKGSRWNQKLTVPEDMIFFRSSAKMVKHVI
ncbi:MAG: 2-C-methyl-D-erythritol 4-phosphate cytidylyltransferase [Candidatus Riflebacteria bacterium]|nr:2-C-methyl-D-erythritol 4-phosphate cytidylyltransferase [Candidatus Riflebacteria bacterium]